MKTVNVSASIKLSKQQKQILRILEEHKGEVSQRELTRSISEGTGKIEHTSRQNCIDHAIKTLRENDDNEQRRLLSLLMADKIQKMPRKGYHYVTASGRASVCRGIRRLEKRNLVYRTLWRTVYLVSMFPERFKEDMLRTRQVKWTIRSHIHKK